MSRPIETLCVVGLGYIGLPTASTFATHGMRVFGVDNNPAVVKALQSGQVHIYEPGLHEVVTRAVTSGNLKVLDKPVAADAFIIAVPTPFYDDKKADMRSWEAMRAFFGEIFRLPSAPSSVRVE